jgi:hypothetical protein
MNLRGDMHTRGCLKQTLYLWAVVFIPIPVIVAAPADPLMTCAEITADTARLACFDREMAERRKNNPPTPARAAPTPEQQFGLSNKQLLGLEATDVRAPVPTTLHAHIVSVSHTAAERQVFALDNAQRWQQIELDPDFAVRIGQEVTISKGALGSFWLATDSHRATRVKRIQ